MRMQMFNVQSKNQLSLLYCSEYEIIMRLIKGTLRRRLTYIFFSFNKKFNI